MGTLTIRNLDEPTKRKLRVRAAAHGISAEQEVRQILAEGVGLGDRLAVTGARLTVEEILEFGRRLPKVDFDQKLISDDLWSFVEKD
ncbi:FitA-like ribbon-helix-helix domain-containing protein [Pseudaminobacter soli (ex Li et al. 2025)]|uniref:Antitoxin FitA-like ribbon-helix-helix domain-containing protein n=1 Tax=Pseudaminobacter soli (ex Li et al. 2025) TaxID=1295366 RepID=A0A2P7RQY5_9HYPH|nr:hypothetical protein [Mesorhizobium soli]PSJ52619.1 hypothetical protein C7I85_28710 [Mesorhizobium soli]